MLHGARLAAIVMLGLVPLTEIGAGRFTHAERKAASPPSAYSPLHHWAPTLYRWGQHLHPPTVPLYPIDRYSGIPNPAGIAVFPNPAVPRGTGLSYDPFGQFMTHSPAVTVEK